MISIFRHRDSALLLHQFYVCEQSIGTASLQSPRHRAQSPDWDNPPLHPVILASTGVCEKDEDRVHLTLAGHFRRNGD